jgi:hypothetical protein
VCFASLRVALDPNGLFQPRYDDAFGARSNARRNEQRRFEAELGHAGAHDRGAPCHDPDDHFAAHHAYAHAEHVWVIAGVCPRAERASAASTAAADVTGFWSVIWSARWPLALRRPNRVLSSDDGAS